MAKKAKQTQPDSFEGIEHALTRTERFIEDNSKIISYVILGIIALVLIVMGAKRFYLTPMEEEAAGQMFMAEKFFERDSFQLALNGYGTYPGFLEITEDYKLSKAANLADYYAGICYLKLGEFENAIDHLESFKTKDLLLGAAKHSAIGDAYVELEQFEKAVKAYQVAIDDFPNGYSTPMIIKKTALVFEEMEDYRKANRAYLQIKRDYPESEEARDIQKYITRTELKMQG
ncbi:MAG: tetratricopeptide repeat protein [Bacteroidales bacterium]|nr:tetratricopeptide repeat protein [Bacteroidales bacterium]